MKSLYAIGTIVLMYSGILAANETEFKDHVPVSSETLRLSELLSYVRDTTQQLIDSDDDSRREAYYELKEGLMIVYALNRLHPEEGYTIQSALDNCYLALSNASDAASGNDHLLQHSLSLFTSSHQYEQRLQAAQSMHDWTDDAMLLLSTIETTDADIVYIQNNVSLGAEEDSPKITWYAPPRLLYRSHHMQGSSPKVLIIKNHKKSEDSSDYKVEIGRSWKLGGKDHGKSSGYVEGQVKDKNGNYASGKVAKEEDDDGYSVDVKAGKEKKHK
jgi:hypothetical protein